jgi:hypothetical protein
MTHQTLAHPKWATSRTTALKTQQQQIKNSIL